MRTDRANALLLLQILQEYSDENHILPMREIIAKLQRLCGASPDRRTIYSAVETLRQCGYDVSDYEENGVGYYLRERLLEPSELRLLTDAVCSFRYIPPRQTRDLIEKLQRLVSVHERRRYRNLTVVRPERKSQNAQIFWNIEVLDEAIAQRRKVSFLYQTYGFDKKLHARSPEPVKVSPYGMVCENERYYLVNIRDGFSTPSLYRIDMMRDVEILDEPLAFSAKDARLNTVRDVTYAYAGEPERIRLRCENAALRHVIDRFGTGIRVSPLGDGRFEAAFTAPPDGVLFWALQYLRYVEVLEPAHLRERVLGLLRENCYTAQVE